MLHSGLLEDLGAKVDLLLGSPPRRGGSLKLQPRCFCMKFAKTRGSRVACQRRPRATKEVGGLSFSYYMYLKTHIYLYTYIYIYLIYRERDLVVHFSMYLCAL